MIRTRPQTYKLLLDRLKKHNIVEVEVNGFDLQGFNNYLDKKGFLPVVIQKANDNVYYIFFMADNKRLYIEQDRKKCYIKECNS